MSTARPFSYNAGSAITGTEQVGNIAIGWPTAGFEYTGLEWWNGPDEELGYVICKPIPSGTQPTQFFSGNLQCSTTYKGVDINLSNSNQTAYQRFGYQMSVLCNTVLDSRAKVMFSVSVSLADPPALPGSHFVGIGTRSMFYQGNPYGAFPGNDGYSVGYGSDGNIWYNGVVYLSGLQSFGNGDIIDIVINNTNNSMWVRKNNGNWNNDPSQDPSTNSGGIEIIGGPFYPVLCPGYEGTMTIQNTSTYGVPSGYKLLGANEGASIGFSRTDGFDDTKFVQAANTILSSNYANAIEASLALTTNGYWNSYPVPVLYLDAGNPSSYPGSGTVWTDLIGGKIFNLINGPAYESGDGGKIGFYAPASQYAECTTSLPSLPIFTISIWHYWNGTNTGSVPCILTEIYVGGPINYFLGNLQGVVAQSGYFNGGFQISPQFTLTPNNWYQIVTTCDSSQVVRVYINNTLISTTPTSGSQPSSGNAGIRLMRRWDDNDYWGGYLGIVSIYNKALNSAQISSIWNKDRNRFGL